MAFSFIAVASGGADGSSSTLDTSTSLNVAEGDLLVAFAGFEDNTGATVSMQKNSGSPANAFTFDAGDSWNNSGVLFGAMGYKIAANADATATFRATWSAARSFRQIAVYQFRPDAGETVSKDGSSTGTGNSNSAASGGVTTTGTDEAVVGCAKLYNIFAPSNYRINGTAADGSQVITGTPSAAVWYKLLTSTMTSGQATLSWGDVDLWVCGEIAFKSVSTGPVGFAIPGFRM